MKRRQDNLKRDRAKLSRLLAEALVALRGARAERDHAIDVARQLSVAARREIGWALHRAPREMRVWRKAGLAHRLWWALTGRIGGGR